MPAPITTIQATDTVGGSRQTINDNFATLQTLAETNEAALPGKSDTGHGHAIDDVAGLQDELDGKADVGHAHIVPLDMLSDEMLLHIRGRFAATVTTNGDGDPTQMVEIGVTTANKKRQTDFTYTGDGDVATVELRLFTSADVFLIGIRKTYTYTSGNLSAISITNLAS